MERSQESEKQRLEQELEHIREQLENREKLHQEVTEKLKSKQDWYVERLEKLYERGIGKHGKRQGLKNRIEEIYQAIRKEKRSHWQDQQQLEKDRREILREIEELENTDFEQLL